MAWYRCRHTGSGGGITPIGDATDGDVKAGKTYMNANGASTGTMTDNGAVSKTLNTTTTSYTVPEGYHNGSGTVSITTQTKSCTPTTSSQTITPDSGKVLSSVSVGTQVHTETKSITAGTSTASTDLTATHNYRYISVAPTPSQSKSVTAPASGTTTVSPDSGKLLSSVVVSPTPSQEKTSTPTTRSATAATVTPDSGKFLSKVTVNTNSVPNSNSGTKTITSSDTNWYTGNVDMGATNTYRYVNAVAVYNKGVSDGKILSAGKYAYWTISGSPTQGVGSTFPYTFPASSDVNVLYHRSNSVTYIKATCSVTVWIRVVGLKNDTMTSLFSNTVADTGNVNISSYDYVMVGTHSGGSITFAISVS